MIDRNSPFLKARHFRVRNFAHLDSSERLTVTTILFCRIISMLQGGKLYATLQSKFPTHT